MGTGHLIKRSLTLKGHRTSVALEPAFWEVLEQEAAQRGIPFARLITDIDIGRGEQPLASALRVKALSIAQDRG